MNAGPTAERVHEALKQAIMGRAYRPGERLDPAVLAEKLNASTTPVREALNQLVGEGLVEARTGSGFHLPALDEPGLKDMYAWSAELLALALRSSTVAVEFSARTDEPLTLADRTGRLFGAIAERSANREHARAVARLNARLHAVRTIEPLALSSEPDELSALEAAFNAADGAELRRSIGIYHRRRVRAAAAILRALYRAG